MNLDVSVTRLPNGLRVLTSAEPRVESVAMGLWVGTGGRYESRAQSGYSHFIEHLVFKGTPRRSARKISQEIEGRGGYFNAFTQEESTCFYARMTSEHMARGVDILADMYLNPLFAPDDIDRERGVILEEILMYQDQPQQQVQDMLGELLWVNHPLGRPLTGTPDNIRTASRDDIVAFKEARYVPGNTVLTLAGKVDHDKAVEVVTDLMGTQPARRRPRSRTVTARTGQRPARSQTKHIEQAHLALGFRVFGRHDERRYATKILSVILGENMSSRLFQRIRETHGLAYSVHSSVHLFRDTGAFVISAGLDRRRPQKALSLVVKELQKLRAKPVSAAELRRAKDYATGQMRIGMESPTGQMMWLGENLLNYDRVFQPEQVLAALEAVTAQDIQALARDIFVAERASLASVLPEGEEALAESFDARVAGLNG